MDGIRPPAPFLDTAATASVPWSAWYADFELYAMAIGWSQWDEARQRALLLHCLGQEGRRRYRVAEEAAATAPEHRDTTPETDETETETDSGSKPAMQVKSEEGLMAKCLSLLHHLFDKPRDAMSERVKFRRLRQKAGESVASFMTNLREQSRYCAFGPLEDEMIRDQFVEGCASDHLRDRLCAKDELTLQRLESIALKEDRAVERQRLMGGGEHRQPGPSLLTVDPEPLEVAYTARGKTARRPVGDKMKDKLCCFACGRRGHVATDDWCPARGQKCRKCGALGHFAVRCNQESIRAVTADESDIVNILAVHHNDSTLRLKVKLGDCWMPMLVDTGAAVSIIPRHVYNNELSHMPLQPTTANLQAYGGSRLAVAGVITATVETEDGRCS